MSFLQVKKPRLRKTVKTGPYSGVVGNGARIQVKPVVTLSTFHNITVFPRKASHALLSGVWSPTITDLPYVLLLFLCEMQLSLPQLSLQCHCSLGHRVKDVFIFGKITLKFYIIICVLWIILRINKHLLKNLWGCHRIWTGNSPFVMPSGRNNIELLQ